MIQANRGRGRILILCHTNEGWTLKPEIMLPGHFLVWSGKAREHAVFNDVRTCFCEVNGMCLTFSLSPGGLPSGLWSGGPHDWGFGAVMTWSPSSSLLRPRSAEQIHFSGCPCFSELPRPVSHFRLTSCSEKNTTAFRNQDFPPHSEEKGS